MFKNSLSVCETFRKSKAYRGEFDEIICELSKELSKRAKNQNLVGKNLSLELKDTKFETKIKSKQMRDYTSDQEIIHKFATMILNEIWPYQPVRLIGLSLGNIITVEEYEKKQKGWIINFLKNKSTIAEEN